MRLNVTKVFVIILEVLDLNESFIDVIVLLLKLIRVYGA